MSPDTAIDRILEFSAEAPAIRREAAENSPAFHRLTKATLAYGKRWIFLQNFGRRVMSRIRHKRIKSEVNYVSNL